MYKAILLLLLIMPGVVFAQRKPPPPAPPRAPTKKELACEEKRDGCSNNSTYSAQQRRAFFPFNKAVKVRLISFPLYMPRNEPSVEEEIAKITDKLVVNGIKPAEFTFDYSQIKEFKDISKAAADSLTEVMYNIGQTAIKCSGLEVADPGASCYNPRNAVLFIDASGKTIAYMEFCFECQRHYFSSYKIKSMAYCTQKYDLLRQFFASQGIIYGTKKRED